MFGVTTVEMVAAAAQSGCLGSLALGDLPGEKCIELIRAVRRLSSLPFAVNIFVNEVPPVTDALKTNYKRTKEFIEQLAGMHSLQVNLPAIEELTLTKYQEQIDAIISENCKILSFTFGNLDRASIHKLKGNGTILVGTCTSVQEAVALEQSGIDVICVQGIEAGGHRGTFQSDNILEIGGLSLLSQVYEKVKAPLIYAGGIHNANTLLASRIIGAQGFQIGSLLLSSKESALKEFEKSKLRTLNESEVVLTKSFSGRYARGIKNAFIETIEHSDYILPYPYQNKLTGELRRIAKAKENLDFVSIWVGQSICNYSNLSTSDILSNLITETEKITSL